MRVPCFSISHSLEPHSVRPVLSTSKCTGAASRPAPALLLDRGRGTSSVNARRLRVVWSGLARSSPRRCMPEPISPSVWRRAKRNTARSVRAVRMARGEYQGCPPRLPTSAAHLGCPPRLPTSAAHLGCPPRLPTSAAHLGCPPRLPTSAAHLGCPRLDGFVGDPDGQAPTLTQAGVVRRPVRDPVRLLGNVVAAVLVQLEGQGKHPRSDEGRCPTCLVPAFGGAGRA